jgi:hypothetical protein
MADTKISALTAASVLADADELVLASGGVSKKLTGANLKPGYGTSLPGSPVNGQEYILVDSLTAPTYAWRLRYTASISDSYKWVFVGGSEVFISAADYTVTGSGAWQISGASFTLPRNGIYDVDSVCRVSSAPPGDQYMGISLVGAPPSNAWVVAATTGITTGTIRGRDRITGVAGNTLQMAHFCNAGLGTFNYRHFYTRPVRIS